MSYLASMLATQKRLQQVFDPRASLFYEDGGDDKLMCEYIKDMSTALMAETIEMLEETGWKPWSSSWHINVEAARSEWIDMWHFMMNLANALQMTPEMIYERYEAKAKVNVARIEQGYDGVSTKCPQCKRALDDSAVECRPLDETETHMRGVGFTHLCYSKGHAVAVK